MFSLVDEEIEAYCEAHSSPEETVLYELFRETHLKTVRPRMVCGHIQGLFLEFLSQFIQPERILELGTFTAYATICLAKGLKENGLIYTIEENREYESIITNSLQNANVISKTKLLFGEALDLIPSLNETWDIIYIDADKTNYLHYYTLLLPSLKKGGIILIDNVLWSGKISKKSNSDDKDTKAIHALNEFIQQDCRVKNLLLPIRDGIMMAMKITD